MDGSGNLYISDTNNMRVLKETLSGGSYSESTVASNASGGLVGPVGVAVDGNGNVYIADYATSKVYMETLSGGTYTQSTIGSGLFGPTGVAVDGSGNVYIAGYDSSQAYKETLSGGTYTQSTIGSGIPFPSGIAVDGSGNVYITDCVIGLVVEEPWMGSGYGTQLTLASGQSGPYGVAVDGSGNAYFANSGSSTIMEFTPAAGNFGAVNIGTASSTAISLNFTFDTGGTIGAPAVLTQGAAGLDFSDAGTGSCTTNGTGHNYSAGDTCTVDAKFTPEFAGVRYGAAVLKNSSGSTIATGYVYGTGTGPQVNFPPGSQFTLGGGFISPSGVAVDGSGNVFVADHNNSAVDKIPPGCASAGCVIAWGGGFVAPYGVAVDGSGNVFVADWAKSVVNEIPPGCVTASCVIALGSGFSAPEGVAVDGSGNVFVSDYGDSTVKEILAVGGYATIKTLGSGFSQPFGVAVDGSGNVFVSDYGDSAVKEILALGGYSTVNTAGSGFDSPEGVAVDGNGNVFVADAGHWAVKEIPAAGGYTITNTLGSGFVDSPSGVAVDASGNVFFSSEGVVKLDYADAPSLSFATTTTVGSTDVTDGPQTVTVENIGNAALTFSALSYPTDFAETGGSDCSISTPLAAGASCPLTISFAPATAGNLNEAVGLTDNNLNAASSQSIAVSGTALAPPPPQTTPTIAWTPPTAINNGSDLSSILNATAQDPSSANSVGGTFSYTATPAGGTATAVTAATVLAPGSYTLIALFTPVDMADYTTATASASLTVNANFGTVAIASPSPTAMTLAFTLSGSPGNGTLASPLVLAQGAPGLDFTDATTGSCTAGTNYSSGIACTVNVTFTPKYAGTRYGAVVLEDSSGTILATEYMSGTGTGPQVNFLPGTQSTMTTSTLYWPQGVAVDGSGNVYIADTDHNRVLKETLSAGNYTESTIGSGLSAPGGIALDAAGNVYIADSSTNMVYKETPSGSTYTQSVIADGLNSPEGVAVDGSGNVYIADTYNSQVLKLAWTGSGYAAPGTIANSALNGLLNPYGVAVDGSGAVYIADTFNGQVLQLPWTGSSYGAPGTVANCTLNGLSYPIGVAVDGSGNVYIADYGNGRVLKETLSGGSYAQSTIRSGLTGPEGVAADGSGNIYLTNSSQNMVWKEDYADAPSLTFATATTVRSMDATDGSQAVTVENIGNAALTFSAVSYPTDFPETGSGDCSTSTPLAAGANCPLTVHFVPAASGPIADSLVLSDNALNNPGATQTIQMHGTGVPGFASYVFAGLPSGLALGTPQAFTLTAENSSGATFTTYTGTAQLSTSDSNAVFSLSSGGAAIASYTFTSSDAGARSLYVTFGTAGSQSITATDSAAGVTDHSGGVLLSQTTPTITWPQPSAIRYGVALTATQMNATASVAGTFAYTPAAGSVLNAGAQTLSVLFTPTDATDYSAASGTVSLTVNQAALTATANNASMLYGAAVPSLGGTLTGVLASDGITARFTTAASSSSPAGSYPITAVLSDPNGKLGNYSEALSEGTLTIATDATTTTVQTSAATVLAENNVTFTARVSSAVSKPQGSVSFLDGGTALGTATLDNTGSATLTLGTLSVGAHSITAVYEGDADFVGSTSGAISETVENFNFTVGGTTATAISATAQPGSSAVYTMQLTPASGSTLAGAVALTLTGVPAGATYTVTPAAIAGGSGSTTVTVTVNIPKQSAVAASSSPKDGDGLPKPWLMAMFLPLLGTGQVRRALRAQMKTPMLMLVLLGALMVMGMTACGSGSGASAQPAQNYTMTLTGTSGGLHHSVTLNLTVQ